MSATLFGLSINKNITCTVQANNSQGFGKPTDLILLAEAVSEGSSEYLVLSLEDLYSSAKCV